ncbi:MAG: AI-2E family transporter [Bacteroidetes bacterium]|nr:AI-2E family transporter [Bacteroidota bacterium]
MKRTIQFPLILRITFIMLFVWLSYFILTEFRSYLAPLCLGILFAYLLFPLANFFEKHGFARILANLLAIVIGLSVIYGIGFFIYKQFGLFIEDWPVLKEQATENVNHMIASVANYIGDDSGSLKREAKQIFESIINDPTSDISLAFGPTVFTLFTVLIMPVYIFFLLFYRNKFKNFILMLVPQGKHAVANRIIDEINTITVRYMTGMFIVVSILVVLNVSGFYIIGLEHALLLGILAAAMNFIPYYGTIIGYLFPLFMAIFVMDSPIFVFLVVLQFVIVQFTENNILTPNIVGSHVNLNPFMIILSITLGGFLWGLPGMIIAVPFAAMIRVLGENIDQLKPIGFLLGQTGVDEHSITKEKIRNFFDFSKKKKN